MGNFLILGSGIALGVYVPALSLKKQLEALGHPADFFCLEDLYRDKESVMEETKRSFHHDFRLARISYRMPVRNRTAVDPEAESAFLADLSEKKYDAVITFSGFFSEILKRLSEECPHYQGRIHAVHMDVVPSLSWKGADFSVLKEIWLYRLEDRKLFCRLDRPEEETEKERRILVHGGGWGIGDYQSKIRRLNELGIPLDIIVYYPEEAAAIDAMNDCYLLDPSWKAEGGNDEFPKLLKYEGNEWREFADRRRINPLRTLIEKDCAVLSKPGGGTIADSLATGTPLLFAEELASYEKENRTMWELCGYGMGFDRFLESPDKDAVLSEMRIRLKEAASGLPVLAEVLLSSERAAGGAHE